MIVTLLCYVVIKEKKKEKHCKELNKAYILHLRDWIHSPCLVSPLHSDAGMD